MPAQVCGCRRMRETGRPTEPVSRMRPINGKRVLVTGAASGIGAGTCRLLAEAGWKVAGLDLQANALDKQMKQLRDEGLTAVAVKADVTSWDEGEGAAETAARERGGGADAAGNGGRDGGVDRRGRGAPLAGG